MNLLNYYLAYETATLRYFIEQCRALTPEQMRQTFDIGHSSVYDTIGHIIRNLEYWTDRMQGLRESARPTVPEQIDPLLERFDAAMTYFTERAHALDSQNKLDEIYEDPEDPEFGKSFGGTLLHVLWHTTVHRWEIQHMLQRLGLTDLLEGDVLEWELLTQTTTR